MGDYKSLPAWKRGMALAHAIYAAAEEAGIKDSEPAKRLRKAAVSVPSLIGEAYLDMGSRELDEALFMAEGKLAEVERLLTDEPSLKSVPEPDRISLLSEIQALRQEIDELRMARATRN